MFISDTVTYRLITADQILCQNNKYFFSCLLAKFIKALGMIQDEGTYMGQHFQGAYCVKNWSY